jgi:hypothetical protein
VLVNVLGDGHVVFLNETDLGFDQGGGEPLGE